jgi:biotin carboxyl carrier protein
MKYVVRIAGRTIEVEVIGRVGEAGGTRQVRVDGEPVEANLVAVDGNLRDLWVDGVVRTVALTPTEDGWHLQLAGESLRAEVTDERAERVREVSGSIPATRGEVVRAPMPGLVLRLAVAPGQPVDAGTGVLVLEAMKMENEIRASTGGVVVSVLVAPGQPVEKGTPLLEIQGGSELT